MTIKELLEMEVHEEYVFNHSAANCYRVVIRVPGGWIYETETYNNQVRTVGATSCFVPEPNLQTTMPIDNGYDEWLKTIEPDFPEPPKPDYDKTLESDKDFATMGRFS
jgi:hypothetical protein